jgi:hypothetical protein
MRAQLADTILFFGSARSRGPEDHALLVSKQRAVVDDAAASADDKAKAQRALDGLARTAWMCQYYDKVQELAKRLTEWSMSRVDDVSCKRGACVCVWGGG